MPKDGPKGRTDLPMADPDNVNDSLTRMIRSFVLKDGLGSKVVPLLSMLVSQGRVSSVRAHYFLSLTLLGSAMLVMRLPSRQQVLLCNGITNTNDSYSSANPGFTAEMNGVHL